MSLVALWGFPLSPTRFLRFHFSMLFSIQETFGNLGKQIDFSTHPSPNTFFLWCLSLSPRHYILPGCGLHPMPSSVFPFCSPSGGLSLAGLEQQSGRSWVVLGSEISTRLFYRRPSGGNSLRTWDKALVHSDLSCVCDTPIPARAYLTSTGSKADAMGPREIGRRKLIQSQAALVHTPPF